MAAAGRRCPGTGGFPAFPGRPPRSSPGRAPSARSSQPASACQRASWPAVTVPEPVREDVEQHLGHQRGPPHLGGPVPGAVGVGFRAPSGRRTRRPAQGGAARSSRPRRTGRAARPAGRCPRRPRRSPTPASPAPRGRRGGRGAASTGPGGGCRRPCSLGWPSRAGSVISVICAAAFRRARAAPRWRRSAAFSALTPPGSVAPPAHPPAWTATAFFSRSPRPRAAGR